MIIRATLKTLLACYALTIVSLSVLGDEPVSLVNSDNPTGGWRFGDGPEFPGAQGEMKQVDEKFRDQPVLLLRGDFAEGGNYVQAETTLPEIPLDALSFWIRIPAGSNSVPIRLVDSSDQCHQIKLKLNDRGEWQLVTIPVEDFFGKMGTAAALDIATQYEKWGGANDGRWHQPGKLFVVLCSREPGPKNEILLSDVLLHPAQPKIEVTKTIQLDEMVQAGELDWQFNLGNEFPGATGGLELVPDEPAPGIHAMHLHADFTSGGAYVGMRKSFDHLDVQAMNAVRLKMRSRSTAQYAMRLVDSSGQCHQQKTMPFTPDGQWHEVVIEPTEFAGGEHWGGADDGKWHGTVQLMELMLNDRSDEAKKPDLYLADIRADVVVEATPAPTAFAEDFESDDRFGSQWESTGSVQLVGRGSGESGKALVLRRSLDALRTETATIGEAFAASPGAWQVQYSWKSDLHSPDNSYHGSVVLDVLNQSGGVVETIPIDIGTGENNWQVISKSVVLPQGAWKARFRVELNKTYGEFWVDELSASRLSVQPIEQRVERILLTTDAVGNLFFPGDKVAFKATVESIKPLPPAEQTLQYSVRDYWGAQQIVPGEIPLVRQPRKNGRFIYTAEIALPADDLAIGRYHELHVGVPQESAEPVAEYSGFAILPVAISKQYKPEEVPFTIRNWDSRITEYFLLADRIGLRLMGVWGGWSAKPPYEPHCPGIDTCRELGAKWITGTPAAQIEGNGFKDYSEDALRSGMRNFLEAYADRGMAMIAMGNEPHGTGEKVLENVRAYRVIYETVKAFDPEIHVIGTSVEPNEEYFRAGYQDYLDSYDFHIYENYRDVRRTMRQYRDLMEKYDAVKPIHSTELGLNSQGQTRLAVAGEMIKKCVSFFAEGGETVSWFTIQYPDPQGKARGQFGDSHCVFDCKYSLYNPRLDAVTYYTVVNGICVKKFVEEKQYAGSAQAYLFRDAQGRCLQAMWLDGNRKDVSVPLSGSKSVELVRIDGSRQTLQAGAGGISVTLSDDPVLLLYEGKEVGLPEILGEPPLALIAEPAPGRPGDPIEFALVGEDSAIDTMRVDCPPLWNASFRRADDRRVDVKVETPRTAPARGGRVYVQLLKDGSVVGELTVPVSFVEGG